jgi:KaiC/GvpD/RAD55 family RecA-like ATPase
VTDRERLSTGIEALDAELGGGLPPGAVVALTAPPQTNSELLLYELSGQRETLFVSTLRSKDTVEDALDAYPRGVGAPVVAETPRDVDFADLVDVVRRAHAGANVVLDTVDPLERGDRDGYWRFLTDLRAHMRSIDGVAMLHGHALPGGEPPPHRDLTLGMADVTFELERSVEPTGVEHRLVVTKLRRGAAPTAPVGLELTDRVDVDTTRDLA